MSVTAEKILQRTKAKPSPTVAARPVLLLTINNGAAHTRAANRIAEAWREKNPRVLARVIDVSDFMSPLARFTHVSAYLWLVKNAPRVWGKIDAYQKKQTQTSPEWFYRRECRKLFDLAREIQPSAIISTEVGCGEIGALLKKDLRLDAPLVAVSLDCDADRAWIQPEVDLYCAATETVERDFVKLGAKPEKIHVWGVPLDAEFKRLSENERALKREKVCDWLELNPKEPIALVSGGGEGLGKIEATVKNLFDLKTQIVVLTGGNLKLKNACEKLAAQHQNLRVLGWTTKVSDLMQAADVSVSKLGLTFYEATACGTPIVALEPPPGAERVQFDLLEKLGVGRAVRTFDEMRKAVSEILNAPEIAKRMRANSENLIRTDAAERITEWLGERIGVPKIPLAERQFAVFDLR